MQLTKKQSVFCNRAEVIQSYKVISQNCSEKFPERNVKQQFEKNIKKYSEGGTKRM